MNILLCFVLIKCIAATIHLDEKYNWKQMDYEYPNNRARQRALDRGELQPENLLPMGIAKFREKLFITIPRWRDGVAATLTYIDTDKTPSGSPKLIPYPSWSGNRFGDCENGLQYVLRIKVDKCNRLWVFDAGYSGNFTHRNQVCLPSVIIYDLDRNVRIRKYPLKVGDMLNTSVIANIEVDIGRNCSDTYAYLADARAFGLVVYSLEQNQSWRFDQPYFSPDPLQADFSIDGLNFRWQVGIIGLSLSEMKPDGYRTLFFNPATSNRLFNVSTRVLRDETRVANSYRDFNVMNERGPNGHVVSQVIDEFSSAMLFTLVDQNAVGCWNTKYSYTPENLDVVDYDNVTLVFPCDLQLDEHHNVWVISNRMTSFFISKLNYSEINFRILTSSVDQIVKASRCDEPRRTRPILSKLSKYQHFGIGFESVETDVEFFRSLWNRN